MSTTEERHTLPPHEIGIARLAIGLTQGIALYLLYRAYDLHAWPAIDANVFGPLLIVALFVPLIAIQALGNVRIATLIVWIAVATAIFAGLTWFDVWSAWPTDWSYSKPDGDLHIMPSFMLFGFVVIGLFVGQALIEGADADRRFIANYHTHFDVAWKLALQIVLAGVFTSVFWGLLWLGAALFKLIDLDFLEQLLEHQWFSIPATTLALAAAIHVTDVRAGLVRGTRTLVLTLLSWLLPLLTGLTAAFLAALVVTGLQPLWDTHYAAGLLMFAALMLLLLINATYQDGSAERRPAAVLRYAGTVAAVVMVPLVALAGYAIFLRVQQYGWTDDRIVSATAAAILAFYAAGYAWAAYPSAEWMKRIERWNFFASLVVLAALVLLLSPIASPMRLAVNDQMARLASGAVDPEKFDYLYFRFEGGRYGREALQRLVANATGPKAALIKALAKAALELTTRSYGGTPPPESKPPREMIRVHPDGATLPETFLSQDWNADPQMALLPACLRGTAPCDATAADLDADGAHEIILYQYSRADVFKQDRDNRWRRAGTLEYPADCRAVHEAILAGQFKVVEPEPPAMRDLMVNGQRVTVEPERPAYRPCPN